ncbi:MAG: peroxiredoxin [Candidatus Limnocylindria bacterium]
MSSAHDPTVLPHGLPVPVDDGACDHVVGMAVPPLVLGSTHGALDLASLDDHRLVLYIYPRTGQPGEPPLPGWDAIPGARGCTPESCAFRDRHAELRDMATVAGLSAQTLEEQREFAERNSMPFPIFSDPELRLARALRLPTFGAGGVTLYKRVTLIAEGPEIVKAFYPVFPPDRHADEVLTWLRARR